MADIIDNGCDTEQQIRERAINAHAQRQRPPLSDGYCVECGDAIPQSRLQANAYAERCIDCQNFYERGRYV